MISHANSSTFGIASSSLDYPLKGVFDLKVVLVFILHGQIILMI